MTYDTDWSSVYNKANVAFSKDINTGYNGDRAVGKLLKSLLEEAQDTSTLVASLIALDKIDENADAAAFKKALAAFETLKKKYVATLDETSRLKPTIKDKDGYNLPTPLKEVFPNTYRQLKLMKTEIEAISARAASALQSALDKAKQDKINADKNAAKSKVKGSSDEDNAKLKEIQDEAAMKTLLLKFSPGFRSAMAKGAAVIQRIKAKPDLATYNAEMNNGGRDISQNLVNVAKLKANPKFKDTKLAKALPAPGSLATEITEFGNGAKRQLPVTATADDVKAALAEFTALYKRIATTYKDVIAGTV